MQVDLKKIKPIGIILILGCSILAFIMCLTVDMGVPEKFVPQHDAEFYLESEENLGLLLEELEERLLPEFEDIGSCYVNADTMKVVVQCGEESADMLEQVLLRDIDPRLFKVVATD